MHRDTRTGNATYAVFARNGARRPNGRILLALGSDPVRWHRSNAAIDRAVQLACQRNATLVLLHVGAWRDGQRRRTGDQEDRSRLRFLAGRWACQQALAADIADRHGIDVEITARWGTDRCRAVLESAATHDVDLILYPLDRRPQAQADAGQLRRSEIPVWLINGY